MAISSIDQIIQANCLGHTFKWIWNKAAPVALTKGYMYNTATWMGSPTAMIYGGGKYTGGGSPSPVGTALVADVSPYVQGYIPHGGNVSPATKYLVGGKIHTPAATSFPSWFYIVDLLVYYPGIIANATSQQLGTVTLPRYSSGAGVQMFLEANTTQGSTASAINSTGFIYTNSAGVTGSGSANTPGMIPGTVQVGTIASGPSVIVNAGVTANNYGPFIPLAAGDLGVQSVQFVQFTAGQTGQCSLVLCKPLAHIMLHNGYMASPKDFVFNIPTMPIIYDGACLAVLIGPGAATPAGGNYEMSLNFVWG